MALEDKYPYYLKDSTTGGSQGYSTLDTAREALFAWIFKQRQVGETVVEQGAGQWSASHVTMWITDREGNIVRLNE